jgi:hypothetical protein
MAPIDDLLRIFEIDKVADLKKHCRTATISRSDFSNLILLCKTNERPFNHIATHRTFEPEHLALTEADLAAMVTAKAGAPLAKGAQKTMNKIGSIFAERRMLSGHLFYNPGFWHFFYFDNRDQAEFGNHWVSGPHIHLINHLLWPNRSAQSVWNEFCNGNPEMKGTLHLRLPRD